jgi:putative flippase GtrA
MSDMGSRRSGVSTAERLFRDHVGRSWRYVLVAGLCALLYNGMMIGLDRLGVQYAISQAATALLLLPTGYLLQGRFTFGASRNWYHFIRYSAALLTNYPVAVATLWVLCDGLRLDMLWAAPMSTFVLFIWNYLTSAWAFLRRNEAESCRE